uniref:GDP-D-glucose phosphorylase 1 n=1 Tax=Rhodnius prolixus TaxID=13249 RepID=T1I961_RHOPR
MEMRFVDTDYLIRTDWNDIKLSTFAETFDRIWKDKMKEGIFKYKINFLKAKMLGGNFQFFAQLNIERAMKRRAPQILSSLTQPFDDKEVNHLSGNCYVLEKHPSKGYVFEIKALVDIHPIIRDIYKLTNFFTENKIAHNMYVTYGLCFERARFLERTTERDCIRIYIWARTYSQEIKVLDEFNPALCELFGHLLVKIPGNIEVLVKHPTEESYNQLTEEKVAEILENITHAPFNATKHKVQQLFAKVK